MGLDVSHDCWHGSYLLFEAFRRRLQTALGLDYYLRFDGGLPSLDVMRAEPLRVLLLHADNEGSIALADTEPLASRLEELAPLLAELPELPGDREDWFREVMALQARGVGPAEWPEMPGLKPEWYAQAALTFAKGLRLANSLGEDVTFG